MASKEEINRRKVISSYLTNPNKTYSAVAKELNMPRTTVSDIIKRYRETKTTERKSGTGKRERGNVTREKKIRSYYDRHPNASVGEIATKFQTVPSNICRIKKNIIF
ncbi:hypothetical protein ILUMI_18744 [Ignelater luminosus]|uniref:Uncharacterized protein n=1 Tax=Ignelater luminosus TaxID=2038154 RepID=A0A8K0G641_IGNLU|nr:hypothetical protein ILUMI_18744 [Ignelater luminosus]